MEVEVSNNSDAEEESHIMIDEVKKYFDSNPDLAALYSNPEFDNIQCPVRNKLLNKIVFDVYQHANTSTT